MSVSLLEIKELLLFPGFGLFPGFDDFTLRPHQPSYPPGVPVAMVPSTKPATEGKLTRIVDDDSLHWQCTT